MIEKKIEQANIIKYNSNKEQCRKRPIPAKRSQAMN